ncbi:hypothetical protein GMD46_16290 [Proteus mirabilis]|nr:hypothetical protein [Proteus mirabilis]
MVTTGVVSTTPSPSVSPGICPSTAKSTLFPGLAGLLPWVKLTSTLFWPFCTASLEISTDTLPAVASSLVTVWVTVSVVLSGRVTVKVISAPSAVPAGKVTSACKPSFSSSAFA